MVAGHHRANRRPTPRLGVRAGLALAGVALMLAACGSDEAADPATSEAAVDETAETASTTAEAASTTAEAAPRQGDDGATATGGDVEADVEADELYPDVIGATAEQAADGSWTISATLSSPYDSPERYADAWRVVGPDGEVYGVRELLHDHAAEQPFTRSQSGIAIPDAVSTVTVEGRDQVSGWGGATLQLDLP